MLALRHIPPIQASRIIVRCTPAPRLELQERLAQGLAWGIDLDFQTDLGEDARDELRQVARVLLKAFGGQPLEDLRSFPPFPEQEPRR